MKTLFFIFTILITSIPVYAETFAPNETNKTDATYRVGIRSLKYKDVSRNRPLDTEIWYPTNEKRKKPPIQNPRALFKAIPTIRNAALPTNKKFPLLLVSHGTGGNRFSLTWFIEKMVEEGYVVVSVDHYGNSTFNKLPREFVKWWERAIDMQFVLTQILNDPILGKRIDKNKIGGVGFSLGGYTNIALAGGYVSRKTENGKSPKLPPEFPKTDEEINFETDKQIVDSFNKYGKLVKDKRIKAFFVMAPAIGFGFHTKRQVKSITAPIFILAGEADSVAPVKTNAKKFHRFIKTSKLQIFPGKVGHYVFLNESTAFGKKVAPLICIDPHGVDRKLIHDQTTKLAIRFFDKNLKK